jgi:hypothetical protein
MIDTSGVKRVNGNAVLTSERTLATAYCSLLY